MGVCSVKSCVRILGVCVYTHMNFRPYRWWVFNYYRVCVEGYSFVNDEFLADIKLHNWFLLLKKLISVKVDDCILMVEGGKNGVWYFNKEFSWFSNSKFFFVPIWQDATSVCLLQWNQEYETLCVSQIIPLFEIFFCIVIGWEFSSFSL